MQRSGLVQRRESISKYPMRGDRDAKIKMRLYRSPRCALYRGLKKLIASRINIKISHAMGSPRKNETAISRSILFCKLRAGLTN
jgi:hypothetical protein